MREPSNMGDTVGTGELEEGLLEPAWVKGATETPPASVPAATSAAPSGGGMTMTLAGFTINETQTPLFIVFCASIVLLIATGAYYRWDIAGGSAYSDYALSIPCISLILSFFALLMSKFAEDTYATAGRHLNMLCFIYSFIGACLLTFRGPFTSTSNGYFAAWAVVYGSGVAAGMTVSVFGFNIKGIGAIMGLIVSSLVLIVASISPITVNDHKDEAVFAISLSCLTFVSGVVFLVVDKRSPRAMPAFAYFGVLAILAICWLVMAGFNTFQGPFHLTSNGYFAAWAGAITATMAAFSAMRGLAE